MNKSCKLICTSRTIYITSKIIGCNLYLVVVYLTTLSVSRLLSVAWLDDSNESERL